MIQVFREYSQSIFFKLLLGLICVTFVISFGVGTLTGERKEVIATVNSEEVLMKDYQQAYNRQLENLRQSLGDGAEEFIKQLNLEQRIFAQLVEQKLLSQNASKVGLRVTDEELADFIQNQPGFQQAGRFQLETYQQILRQNRMTVDEYEGILRQELLLQKYQDLLQEGVTVSDAEVDQAYRQANETLEVSYIEADPKLLENSIPMPAATEIEKYYKENPNDFQQPKQFKLEYFTLNLSRFKNPSDIRDREIERYYEKNQDQFRTPPEVKARHILIQANKDLPEAERQAKLQQAEKILAELKGGAKFEDLAQKYSEDSTKDKGGDLGWFQPGDMVGTFEEAAFTLEVGKTSEVVESPFGFHIVRVDDKRPEVVKKLEEVRQEIIESLTEERANKKLELEYTRIQDRLGKEEISAIAQGFGVAATTTPLFDHTAVLPGLGTVKAMVGQLQEKKANQTGSWQRNPVQGHIFYKVLEIVEPSLKPLEKVQDQVIHAIRVVKAQEKAKQVAQEILEQAKQGKTLEDVAKAHQWKVETTSFKISASSVEAIGNNPEFKKVALGLKKEAPLGLSQWENQTHVILFKERSLPEAGDTTQEKSKLREQLVRRLQQAMVQKEIIRLRNLARIDILNSNFEEKTPNT